MFRRRKNQPENGVRRNFREIRGHSRRRRGLDIQWSSRGDAAARDVDIQRSSRGDAAARDVDIQRSSRSDAAARDVDMQRSSRGDAAARDVDVQRSSRGDAAAWICSGALAATPRPETWTCSTRGDVARRIFRRRLILPPDDLDVLLGPLRHGLALALPALRGRGDLFRLGHEPRDERVLARPDLAHEPREVRRVRVALSSQLLEDRRVSRALPDLRPGRELEARRSSSMIFAASQMRLSVLLPTRGATTVFDDFCSVANATVRPLADARGRVDEITLPLRPFPSPRTTRRSNSYDAKTVTPRTIHVAAAASPRAPPPRRAISARPPRDGVRRVRGRARRGRRPLLVALHRVAHPSRECALVLRELAERRRLAAQRGEGGLVWDWRLQRVRHGAGLGSFRSVLGASVRRALPFLSCRPLCCASCDVSVQLSIDVSVRLRATWSGATSRTPAAGCCSRAAELGRRADGGALATESAAASPRPVSTSRPRRRRVPTEYPRRGRGRAATRLCGLSGPRQDSR